MVHLTILERIDTKARQQRKERRGKYLKASGDEVPAARAVAGPRSTCRRSAICIDGCGAITCVLPLSELCHDCPPDVCVSAAACLEYSQASPQRGRVVIRHGRRTRLLTRAINSLRHHEAACTRETEFPKGTADTLRPERFEADTRELHRTGTP